MSTDTGLRDLALRQAVGDQLTCADLRKVMSQFRHLVAAELLAAGFEREANLTGAKIEKSTFSEILIVSEYFRDRETGLNFTAKVQLHVDNSPRTFGSARLWLLFVRETAAPDTPTGNLTSLLARQQVFSSKVIAPAVLSDAPSDQLKRHILAAAKAATTEQRQIAVQLAISRLGGLLSR